MFNSKLNKEVAELKKQIETNVHETCKHELAFNKIFSRLQILEGKLSHYTALLDVKPETHKSNDSKKTFRRSRVKSKAVK